MRIAALCRYPVKSLRGTDEAALEVRPWGPLGDRRWALVDEAGDVITARTEPSLLTFEAMAQPDGGIEVVRPDGARLRLAAPRHGTRVPTRLSRVPEAIDAGLEAQRFFTSALNRPARLVWQAEPTERSVNRANGGLEGEVLSLADAGPLLLTSRQSLGRLQEWVGEEPRLSMTRFRPNVVVDGAVAFEEDAWPAVRLGAVDFRVQQACDRCVMTTIDPETLDKGPEPLRTLARHRKWDGKTWFGVWLVPQAEGVIRVGDAVLPEG